VHVVLHTGEAWDDIAADANELGLAAVVPKPAEPSSLLQAVTRRPSVVG
jgi:hypothetical protein